MKSSNLHDGYDFILTFDSTRGWLSIKELDWKQVRLHVLQLPLDITPESGNLITYNACISACEKAGEWAIALVLFQEVFQHLQAETLNQLTWVWCACGVLVAYPFGTRGRPVAVPLLTMFLFFSGLQMIEIRISSCDAGGIFSVQSCCCWPWWWWWWWGWCLLLSASNPRQAMLSPPNLSIWEMHQGIDIPLTSGPSKMVTTECLNKIYCR